MSKALGIIMPVYNEGDNIKNTINAIDDAVKTPYRIYIVYDFDGDNTIPAARKLQEAGVDIKFVRNPIRGVVYAIKIGLKTAEEGWLLVTMADLSDDYSVVDGMCGLMEEGYDVVCGSRYMRGGRQMGGPVLKKALSRTVGMSLKYMTGLPTHDVTNSFKLYRRSMIHSMELESEGGFEISMEIVTKAHFSGFRVTEIPCVWTAREKGASRFKIMAWAPKYLRWYFYAFKMGMLGGRNIGD